MGIGHFLAVQPLETVKTLKKHAFLEHKLTPAQASDIVRRGPGHGSRPGGCPAVLRSVSLSLPTAV